MRLGTAIIESRVFFVVGVPVADVGVAESFFEISTRGLAISGCAIEAVFFSCGSVAAVTCGAGAAGGAGFFSAAFFA